MPFGGGGALHTGALMAEVGLGSAIVPRFPGVTSALGCVVADMRHDRVQTVNRLLADLDCAALEAEITATAKALEEALATGVAFERIDRELTLDMLYLGQTHTVAVPVPMQDLSHATIQAAFDAAYGENDPKGQTQFGKNRHVLRHDVDGVEKVIRALAYLRSKHPRRKRIAEVLGYFRRHRHRMDYAAAARDEKLCQLARRESEHLRSRRLRLAGSRFESLKIIGRGAFGEVR